MYTLAKFLADFTDDIYCLEYSVQVLCIGFVTTSSFTSIHNLMWPNCFLKCALVCSKELRLMMLTYSDVA